MPDTLINKIRDAVIGEKHAIHTSFGCKPLIYADYTASGRALDFIEQYISEQVLPFYANTHTETSYTGAQTTLLREQARDIIHAALNGSEEDQVIFCGSGATSGINKLIDILNIRLPADLDERYQLLQHIPASERAVVFIGPYEHHSNELPWRETTADLVVIPLDNNGHINIEVLATKLEEYSERSLKIGSFSAASNVTGIKSDVNRISALLHKSGAQAFWDYAAAAPYVAIDMNANENDQNCSKDAVFLSPHKFVGGPGTPGILVVKKHLLNNRVPAMPGGGTVMYVTPEDHQYVSSPVRREEGGTPAIVESIRAGLVFKLQQDVGTELIENKESEFIQRALKRWALQPNIKILGSVTEERLSIFSLRFMYQDKDLHYAYIVALLNDLFGIQARGGCSCAGPYGHALLGMDMAYSKALEKELQKGLMVMRPGWVRLNFNYFIDEDTFNYLVSAIELIAQYGAALLPYYQFDSGSGTWCYQGEKMNLVSNLNTLNFREVSPKNTARRCETPLSEILSNAKDELIKQARNGKKYTLELPESAERLRWFALPQEI